MIRITCESCGQSFKVKEQKRGRSLPCKCGATIEVPLEGGGDKDSSEADSASADAAASASADAADDTASAADLTRRAAGAAGKAAGRKARALGASLKRAGAGALADGGRSAMGSGVLASLLPPSGGAVRTLWLGLVLLVVSFGIKQVFVSWALSSVATAVEAPRLMAKRSAVLSDLHEDVERLELEKRYLRAGPDAKADERKSVRERRTEIDKEIEKIRKDNAEDEREIRQDYAEDLLDAGNDAEHAMAFGLRKTQWFLSLKLLLDILKVIGAVLVVFSALRIAADEDQPAAVKTYSIVCGGLALLTVLLGGLVSLLG